MAVQVEPEVRVGREARAGWVVAAAAVVVPQAAPAPMSVAVVVVQASQAAASDLVAQETLVDLLAPGSQVELVDTTPTTTSRVEQAVAAVARALQVMSVATR